MAPDEEEFRDYKIFIIDALKRHEEQQDKNCESNAKEHKAIMEKLGKLEVIVTANEREMKIRQGLWGGLGGAAIMAIKILHEFVTGGTP